MTGEGSYNPLDKINIARSIAGEVLDRPVHPLSDYADVTGDGVYIVYYTGNFPAYAPIAKANARGNFAQPIYVGKAIPAGGRKGAEIDVLKDAATGRSLARRLGKHAQSITQVSNLELEDFFVRYLVVEEVFIPLGERILISTFKPLWNRALDGFGNNDVGEGRKDQERSPWDVLHPGREVAQKQPNTLYTPDMMLERAEDYLAGRPLKPLPQRPRKPRKKKAKP